MYNIEEYIQYCLDSCVKQNNTSIDDYEVIIVNDGSTDRSLSIAEAFVRERENFRIINQKNAGLSCARNMGLSQAKGEYIWFVDGDDAIAPNAVSTLLSVISFYHTEAIICNFSTFDGNGIKETSTFPSFPIMSGKRFHDTYLQLLPMMAWLTIYRTEQLKRNNLLFLPDIYHEDKEFSVRAHHCMNSIIQIPEALYYYRVSRPGSIMDGIKKDNTKSLISEIKIIDSFTAFFKKEDTPFARKLLGLCAMSFLIRRYDSSSVNNGFVSQLFNERKKQLYHLMLRSGQWKQHVLLLFIIITPPLILCRILPSLGNRARLM